MQMKAFAAVGLIAGVLAATTPAVAQGPTHLTLNYDGSLFVKVLDVAIEQAIDGERFTASAHIRTSGILALFRHIDLKASAQGRIEDAKPAPRLFTYANIDGKKNRHVMATWTGADVETQSQPHYPDMGDPPASREQQLEAADPLTNLTRVALTPQGQRPCQGPIHFYDGKQRYDLDFTYKGPAPAEERERRLGLTDTIRCSLVYREVAGFKRKPPEQRSQGLRRDVTIGLGRLGPGGPWVVSLLRADTFLGAAEINLVNLRVAHEAPE